MLSETQLKTSNLEEHLHQLRIEIEDSATSIQSLEANEKELADKAKEQVSYLIA